MNERGSLVSEFYKDRHILITGATGFVGKVLLEKLLRSCSQIDSIYLLMRPKSGVDMKTRFNELLNASLFDQIKQNNVELLKKLVPIHGDITLPELGLSKEDQQLLIENVSVVFHSAATVKFDEALKQSVNMNLLGTKKLVQLCQKMSKLEALVHVSTAYCNCNEVTVLEKVYPPPADPETIIQCVESLDEDIVNSITPQIISNRPNTYTYTKALAESVLSESGVNLPIAIVRPSIVTAAWKEPLQGWVDNLNGPTGIFVGVAKGILRTLHAHRNLVADFVPVDIAINLMIVVAWHISITKPNRLVVYNCSSGLTNPIFWGDIEKWTLNLVLKHPCTEVVWYPGGSFKYNSFMNSLAVAAFHTAPAYILDMLTRLCGKKPILVRIQKKLNRATSSLEFFTTHEWKFVNNNMLELYEKLNVTDKKFFNFNVNEVNWSTYMEEYWLGVRKFILKEDPSNIPNAYRHLQKYYWIHRISQLFMVAIFWRFLLKKSRKLQNAWYSAINLLFHLSKLLLSSFLQVT